MASDPALGKGSADRQARLADSGQQILAADPERPASTGRVDSVRAGCPVSPPQGCKGTTRTVLEWAAAARTLLGWRLAGPVLILIGVSQAAFNWAGQTTTWRVLYSAVSLLIGLGLMILLRRAAKLDPPSGN